MDYGDAQAPKVFRRSDARKRQELGGSDCAAAENDLVALDGELLAAALYLRAYGLVAFEDDPVDGAVGPDRQVEPVPGRSR